LHLRVSYVFHNQLVMRDELKLPTFLNKYIPVVIINDNITGKLSFQ